MVRMSIDGRCTEAREGATVLEAAHGAGVEIPTFCHHDALRPFGACRLCIVEVEAPGLPRTILPACTLRASQGLVVETATASLQLHRTTIVQLLLASLPRNDKLASLGRRFGVESTPFRNERGDVCALCGLCVRACRERMGAGALALAGDATRPFSVAQRIVFREGACLGCGTCASLCPVGAFVVEDRANERTVSLYGQVVARFELLPCAGCGAPTTTERVRSFVLSRLDDVQRAATLDLCPSCARERGARALTGNALALED